jgi:superfamily II DNA or RNA helicase
MASYSPVPSRYIISLDRTFVKKYYIKMRFKIVSPTKALISNYSAQEFEDLKVELTYTNTAAQHMVKRHFNNQWARRQNPTGWQIKLDELKAEVKKTLVFQDDDGKFFVRPGSLPYLSMFSRDNSEITYTYSIPKRIAWAKPLPFELYPYQTESFVNLINVQHGNVELCTGAGKSAILLKLCRETGFKCAIIAPSRSIFRELMKSFEKYLGKNNVGGFGDGKKKIGKRITICIGDSLSNVKKGTEEWEFFSKLEMIAVDESHTWGAETLENLCHGIFADVPYRFFMSGTQTRGDGTEKLLQSIIGRTVHTLGTKEAIAGGYICPHDFSIVEIESSNPNYNSADILEMKRIHFLNNRNIAAFVSKLANIEATTQRRQILVLVEELTQISMLVKLLKVPFAYAHSEANKQKLVELGLEKVDTEESVEKFNKNEVQVLIGTSCIATGTNIYPTHYTINWCGGASEIRTKQGAVGRSVRLGSQNPYKEKCLPKSIAHIFDFDVIDAYALQHHLTERITYYQDSGASIRRIKFTK